VVGKQSINIFLKRFELLGIIKMLEKLGLTFDGRHHSGLADATNIARVAIELLKVCLILR